MPVHVIARRLGHADLQTTSGPLVESGDDLNSVADLLDRRHQAQRRPA